MMTQDTLHSICSLLLKGLPNSGWALTGGASLFARGFVDTANDIDILATRACAEAAALAFSDYSLRPLSQSQEENILSFFADYMILGVRLEIMAEVSNRDEHDAWIPHTDWINHIQHVHLEPLTIPMLSLQYEAEIAKMLKQHARLEVILDALGNENPNVEIEGRSRNGVKNEVS